MVRGFTPIIGLAVVMALALAAVFGSMSLANPAMAAFGQPADAELTERVDSPLMDPEDDIPTMHLRLGTADDPGTLEFALGDYFDIGMPIDSEGDVAAGSYGPVTWGTVDSGTTATATVSAVEDNAFTITAVDLGISEITIPVSTQTFVYANATVAAAENTGCDARGGTLSDVTCTFSTTAQTFTVVVHPMDVFKAESEDPGEATRYEFNFTAAEAFDGALTELKIKMEDFGFPSSIAPASVSIAVEGTTDGTFDTAFPPEDVTVRGSRVVINIGANNPNNRDTAGNAVAVGIGAGDDVKVVIRQSAGISNPTEAGGYPAIIEGFSSNLETEELEVPYLVELDEDDGGRGTPIIATGKGFKNGTSLTFWLEVGTPDGVKGSNEEPLCTDDSVSGNIGTCEFVITNPPFIPGDMNYVNAVDGSGMAAMMSNAHKFELKPSIAVTPKGGSPGQTMLVQLVDFGVTAVQSATLAGEAICDDQPNDATLPDCTTTLTIPNFAEMGSQRLEVVGSNGKKASTNIVIGGPTVTVSPSEIVPNQRLSLTGAGFTPNERITDITIGSQPFSGFNDNQNSSVTVDANGNWSTSVIVPIASATVSPGDRAIRVSDSANRSGTYTVTIPARKVSIDPPSGRIGTLAVVRGENFPSQNDDGVPVNITITYKSSSPITVSAAPNASGSFEAQLRVPTTAVPGQSHSVEVSFGAGLPITTVQHEVPAGTITLSKTSGVSGSTLTITGEGFRAFVPVNSVTIGGLEVTPAPKPSTDALGNFEFDVLVPGLGNGIQTVEVQVGGGAATTTASVGYTVTQSGVEAGAVVPVADGLSNLGDNLESIWHFNNDTKSWSFYDGLEGSDLEELITGETYLIQVKATVQAILNNKTRNLTCNDAGNCWNQIVW